MDIQPDLIPGYLLVFHTLYAKCMYHHQILHGPSLATYLSTYVSYAYMLPSRTICTSMTSNYKIENKLLFSDLSTICSICSMYLYHIMRKGSGGEASGKSVGIYKHFFRCNLSIFCVVISQVSPSFSLYRYRNQPHQFHEFTGK